MKEEERQADSENFQVLPGLPHTHRAARIDCIRHFGPIWPQFQNSNGKNWLKSIICRLMRYARVWPGTQIRHWKSLSSRKIYWWRWKCRLIGTIFIWVNRTDQFDVDKIWLTNRKNINFTGWSFEKNLLSSLEWWESPKMGHFHNFFFKKIGAEFYTWGSLHTMVDDVSSYLQSYLHLNGFSSVWCYFFPLQYVIPIIFWFLNQHKFVVINGSILHRKTNTDDNSTLLCLKKKKRIKVL